MLINFIDATNDGWIRPVCHWMFW